MKKDWSPKRKSPINGDNFEKLSFGECLAFESHRVVGLRPGLSQGNRVIPALVDAFNEDIEVRRAIRA